MGHGHIRMPGIFADRRADPDRAKLKGLLQRRAGKNPLFIKDGIVGQFMFQHFGQNSAVFQIDISVKQLSVAQHWRADGQGRAAPQPRCQGQKRQARGLDKGGLQHQILRLIPGQEHLAQRHKVHPLGRPRSPCGKGTLGVGRQIAQHRIGLHKGDAEMVGHGGLQRFTHPFYGAWRVGERPRDLVSPPTAR